MQLWMIVCFCPFQFNNPLIILLLASAVVSVFMKQVDDAISITVVSEILIPTHLTHSYILRKDHPPLCEHCQCTLTVRHILVECNHFAQERKDIFGRRDVVESFRFHPTLIVLFLKQIELYYKF